MVSSESSGRDTEGRDDPPRSHKGLWQSQTQLKSPFPLLLQTPSLALGLLVLSLLEANA